MITGLLPVKPSIKVITLKFRKQFENGSRTAWEHMSVISNEFCLGLQIKVSDESSPSVSLNGFKVHYLDIDNNKIYLRLRFLVLSIRNIMMSGLNMHSNYLFKFSKINQSQSYHK